MKVTYHGPAGRYYLRDRSGRRVWLPRGQTVDVPDEIAERLKGREDVKVHQTPAANPAAELKEKSDGS